VISFFRAFSRFFAGNQIFAAIVVESGVPPDVEDGILPSGLSFEFSTDEIIHICCAGPEAAALRQAGCLTLHLPSRGIKKPGEFLHRALNF
jgi:hypothetical protein